MQTPETDYKDQTGEFVSKFIYATPKWKLIASLITISLLKSGIWFMPNTGVSLLIAQNPFANPFPDWPEAQYLYWSWLGPFLAWCIGATRSWSFLGFHFAFAVLFTALFVWVIFSRLPDREARTAFVLFTVLPVSMTPYFWLSMDSLTLFLMVSALALRKIWPLTLLVGVALGMQHFEQGFCAATVLLVAIIMSKYLHDQAEYSLSWTLSLLAGVVLGKLVLFELFLHWHVAVNSGRLFWLLQHRNLLLAEFYDHFQYVLYSVFGVGWLFVIKYGEKGKKALPLFIGILGVLLLLPISADQTRVSSIASFLLIAVFCLLNSTFLASLSKRFSSWLLLTWFIAPYAWVWQGTPKWSILPYDIELLLHKALGWFSVPANKALWPF